MGSAKQARNGTCHTSSEGARDERLGSQGNNFLRTFRAHAAEPRYHNSQATEIGEATEGLGENDSGLIR